MHGNALLLFEVFVLHTSLVFLEGSIDTRARTDNFYESPTFKRWTAVARSLGVRNHALVGESGKKNLCNTLLVEVTRQGLCNTSRLLP